MFVNLAYLLSRPTGTTSYALNLLPYLDELSPIYLATPASGLSAHADVLKAHRANHTITVPIPENMTAANGTAGHLRRLWWTQLQLPKLIPKLITKLDFSLDQREENRPAHSDFSKPLLFTPIPEAPLPFFGALPLRSVVMFHDLIPLRFPKEFGAIKYYFRYYVPQVLAQAEKVICNSEATARDIVDFYDLPARKIIPIPLAHDANHFRPVDMPPGLSAELNLSEQPYFLTLGRQAPYKNISRVVEALAQVPDCSLVIAGPEDSRYTPALRRLAEAKGVRSRVKFISYVPYSQLPALLSGAIALVFPSLWEGFGLPVLEAMACGTPVVTSNLASLPEVAGDAAYLINPYRLVEIIEAMKVLSTDEAARWQLRRAGLQRAMQFSWEKTGAQTVQVLQPLA